MDLNATATLSDSITLLSNVGNLFNARTPIAPATCASSPNCLVSWHYAGLIGRTFCAGASFPF